MKGRQIQEIVKQFPGEWVLIHILKMDEETTTPILGELLAHAKKMKIFMKYLLIMKERKIYCLNILRLLKIMN